MLAELEIEPGDPTEVFELLAKLGKGSYASVYKARDTRDGSVCAIKVLEIELEDTKALIKEIRILKNCNSEYIVKFKGSYLKENHLWLVMEYCGLGSVCDIMSICQKKFTEPEIVGVLIQALRGLDYLHKLKMIHRDIKSGNILLNHDGDCKLADFGVSAELENTLAKRKTLIGTPYWMAPEVLQAASYDSAADIWSIGITAYEMAVGHPPHIDKHPLRAIFVIPTLPSPTLPEEGNWSKNFVDFLALCLNKSAKERPSAAALLEHPFLVEDRDKVALRNLVATCRDTIDEFRENQSSDEDSCDDDDYDYNYNDQMSPVIPAEITQHFDFDPSAPIEVDLAEPVGNIDTGTFHPSPEMTLLLEKAAAEAKRDTIATPSVPVVAVVAETKPSPKNTLEIEPPQVVRLDTTTSPSARLYRTQRVPELTADASPDALRNLVSLLNMAHFQERAELDTYYQQCKNTVHQVVQQRGLGTLVQKGDEKQPPKTINEIGKTSSGRKVKDGKPTLTRDDAGHKSGGSGNVRIRTPPDLPATASASSKSWQIYNEKNSRSLKNLRRKPKVFVTTLPPRPEEPRGELPQLAGYLYKRGKQSKEWLRRYFVLANGTLSYWVNDRDFAKQQNPRGTFTVRGAMVQVYPTGASPFHDGGLEDLKCVTTKQPRKSVFSTLRSGAMMGSRPHDNTTLRSGGKPPPPPAMPTGDYSAIESAPSTPPSETSNGTLTAGVIAVSNGTLVNIKPEPEARAMVQDGIERDWTVFSLRPVTLDRVYYLVTGATSDLDRKQWLTAIEIHGGWLTQRPQDKDNMTRVRSQSVTVNPLMALSLHTPLARNPSATRAISPYHTTHPRRSSSLHIDPLSPPKTPR